MELRYLIGDTSHTVTVQGGGAEPGARRFRLAVDGVERDVEIVEAGAHRLDLLVDGRRVTLHVAPGESPAGGEPPLWLSAGGWSRVVAPAPEARRAAAGVDGAASMKPRKVTPTFPATVVAVFVEVGAEVTRGQPLVVVSAMKMEMTLTAPHDGIVRAVNATPGAAVSPGDELVVVERRDEDPERRGGGDER
jgi:biotin carboxyl carrier protein